MRSSGSWAWCVAVAIVAVVGWAPGTTLAGPAGEPLPAAPTLVGPPHQAEIAYDDPARATTRFAWQPVQGAASYHLMVDQAPFFSRPIVDRKGIRDAVVSLRGLEPGKYYWCVAAADQGGREGKFSEFARFTIVQPSAGPVGQGPNLVIDAVDVRGNIVHVRGKTAPGATLTINGQAAEVRPDGAFNELVAVPKPGRQDVQIRAVGRDGGVTEAKRSVVVSF